MKIKLTQKHLVVDPFFAIELPELAILTGVNGAGKTKILDAISQGIIQTEGINQSQIKFVSNHILSENEISHQTDISSFTSDLRFDQIKHQYSRFKVYNPNNRNHSSQFSMQETEYIFLKPTFEKIAKLTNKDINEINDEDIKNFLPLEHGLYNQSIFYENFKNLFYKYFLRVNQNDLYELQNKKYSQNNIFYLESEKFIEAFGESPWDFSNKILEEASIPYRFKSPLGSDPNPQFKLTLQNINTGLDVEFSAMSSGEKVILSLVFAMYNSKLNLDFPKVLLMDEPDASLHPSMIKHFLNVIKTVFVKEKKIKVIITTHSPTTIALADEESIFTVDSPGAKIVKRSKDAALKVLTEGVPSFSVNYENRRQIFVESPYDAEYYEELYKIFLSYLQSEISLYFIPSGDVQKNQHGTAKNSCDIVIEITNIMRHAGNNFIWGIIDFDNKNKSTDHIKVLGEGKRYSTENYFFDPILLAIFLLIDDASKVPDIGLKSGETYIDVINFDNQRLQIICESILEKIKEKTTADNLENIPCKLINGNEVQLPKWFLMHQGHDLEIAIKKAFPQLEAYKKDGDKTLKIAIIKKVIAIFPGLASEDLLQILKSVQD